MEKQADNLKSQGGSQHPPKEFLEDVRRTTYESEIRLGESIETANRIADKVTHAAEMAWSWTAAHPGSLG